MLNIMNPPLERSDEHDYRSRQSGRLTVGKTSAKFLRRIKNKGLS